MSPSTRPGSVFISYKREEAPAAERLRDALVEEGFQVWWDEDLQCGQAWAEVLDEAVRVVESDDEDEDKRPEIAPPVLPGVIVGREMVKNLSLYLGDEVKLISPLGELGPTGPMPKSRTYRVAAVFFSGMYEYDAKNVYVTLESSRRFLGIEEGPQALSNHFVVVHQNDAQRIGHVHTITPDRPRHPGRVAHGEVAESPM